MRKVSLDYVSLDNQLHKKVFKLDDVKNRLEKVAFDIVRFKDNDKASELWQVQKDDDGEYIVALYEEGEKKVAGWDVALNKMSGELDFYYKGEPIIRLASSKLGIPPSELNRVESYLPEKLENNKKLVHALLKELPTTTKKEVLKKYPELEAK